VRSNRGSDMHGLSRYALRKGDDGVTVSALINRRPMNTPAA